MDFQKKLSLKLNILVKCKNFINNKRKASEINKREKMKELLAPLKTENEELLKKVDECHLTIEQISADLTNKNLEISTQLNLNQELKHNQ